MNGEIEQVFMALPPAEVLGRLETAQIANARLNTVQQFIEHPQLAGRDAWRQVDSAAGAIPALVPPVRMEGVEPRMDAIPASASTATRSSPSRRVSRADHRTVETGRDRLPVIEVSTWP